MDDENLDTIIAGYNKPVYYSSKVYCVLKIISAEKNTWGIEIK